MTARRSIIPVFVPHLGCPHQCVFCDQRRISGQQKPAGAEDVRRAVLEGLERLPQGTDAALAFYGGSFTAIPREKQEELLGAALPFLRDGRLAGMRLSTRPDAIDQEILDRLRQYGVRTVELGVQSMDEQVLIRSGRGHTARDAVCAARMVKEAGFELILQMMTGLPGDTAERSLATARKFVELSPDGVRVYPTVVVKDTPLYNLWKAGLYREHTVEDAVEICARISEIFYAAGIPIIRLGLNPTRELSAGDAVAGAYHPALGELVLSRRFLEREKDLLSPADRGRNVAFAVKKGRVSAAVGQKRGNAAFLRAAFGLKKITFYEREMPDLTVERLEP